MSAPGCDWVDLTIKATRQKPLAIRQILDAETGEVLSSALHATDLWVRDDDPEQPESGSTRILIRPGRTPEELYISGNIARWGKRDNVWQPDVRYTLTVLLPAILRTAGCLAIDMQSIELHRLDLCRNFRIDPRHKARYLGMVAGVRLGRHSPASHEHSVYWAKSSQWWSAKIYEKVQDLQRRRVGETAERLARKYGAIMRQEVKLKGKELRRLRLEGLDGWLDEPLAIMEALMNCKFKPLDRLEIHHDPIDDCGSDPTSRRLLATLHAYRNGVDVFQLAKEQSKTTAYRLRSEMLTRYGIDIKLPPNVTRMTTKTELITLEEINPPPWYEVTPAIGIAPNAIPRRKQK